MNHNRGDVYLVLYPFDDGEIEKLRPGIVLDTRENQSIVIKVTSHAERAGDPKDLVLKYWQRAGLSQPSVARCSQFVPLHHDKIGKYLGTLHDEDLLNVLGKFYE
ncbi:type II toxin-antitoxin system PemK/MazF family toxin [Paenibacillus sp. IHBB 3054]|uniref:type II toxin-antitoxin system PemK/MazF family toxin n=1 Tax=Paenibacillus sp. IHBB 3054 TaxID=3425689 RepID=UPI003F66CF74